MAGGGSWISLTVLWGGALYVQLPHQVWPRTIDYSGRSAPEKMAVSQAKKGLIWGRGPKLVGCSDAHGATWPTPLAPDAGMSLLGREQLVPALRNESVPRPQTEAGNVIQATRPPCWNCSAHSYHIERDTSLCWMYSVMCPTIQLACRCAICIGNSTHNV